MRHLLRHLILCLLSAVAGPALADREVHVVSVGSGHRSADPYALPEAHVLVDRPGQEVALVLLDAGDLHWRIEATPGTYITELVRSGPDTGHSRVSLSGIPMTGVNWPGLPLVYNPWGRNFRDLVVAASDRFDTARIHGLHSVYRASATPIMVERTDDTTPGLSRDHLSARLAHSDDQPAAIRPWTREMPRETDHALAIDRTGITLTGPGGTRKFPVSDDVPALLLPVGAVYDAESETIYCATYGGVGHLYAVDTRTGEWSVLTDLAEYDPAALMFDAAHRLLILTGAFSRPGDIRLFGLDGSRAAVFIATTDFPGLTDLFDYGNEHGPPLDPLAYRDGWLLLRATAAEVTPPAPSRTYAVEIATGEVRLLRVRD